MASNREDTGRRADRTATVLDRLFEVVVARRDERPEGSYVVRLLDGGWQAIEAKLREEAQEVVDAARDESDEALAHEAADLIFHLWVMLASRGLEPSAVYAELERRFGIGGLEEMASRVAVDDRSDRSNKDGEA
jgi:phosphoribosyl-ATP pyrophosphohydrolase